MNAETARPRAWSRDIAALLEVVEAPDEGHGDREEGEGGEDQRDVGHDGPHLVGRDRWRRAMSWQAASHSGNCSTNRICSLQRRSRASSRGPEPQSRWSSPKACSYTA